MIGFSLGGIFTSEVTAHMRDTVTAVCNWCGGIPSPRKWMDDDLRATTLLLRPDLGGAGRKMPVFLLTASKDINKVEVDGAREEYTKHGWPTTYECQEGADTRMNDSSRPSSSPHVQVENTQSMTTNSRTFGTFWPSTLCRSFSARFEIRSDEMDRPWECKSKYFLQNEL